MVSRAELDRASLACRLVRLGDCTNDSFDLHNRFMVIKAGKSSVTKRPFNRPATNLKGFREVPLRNGLPGGIVCFPQVSVLYVGGSHVQVELGMSAGCGA